MTKPMMKAWEHLGSTGEHAHLVLLSQMIAEVWEIAAPEQAVAFLRTVGGRIARDNPVADLRSNNEILGSLNAYWTACGWGAVDFRFMEDGLHLDHVGLPAAPEGVPVARWIDSVGAVLAGAYDEWLGVLGGAPSMHARVVAINAREAELHYGV